MRNMVETVSKEASVSVETCDANPNLLEIPMYMTKRSLYKKTF
jgi:hypothetical protein